MWWVLSLCIAVAAAQSIDPEFGLRTVGYGGRDAGYSIVAQRGVYYVTGTAFVNQTDFGVAALSYDGTLLWQRNYDLGGNGSRTDVPTRIVAHQKGFVIGGTTQVAPVGNNLVFSLIKIDRRGDVVVQFGSNGIVKHDVDPTGVNDEIFDLAVDRRERIVATGFSNPGQIVGAGPAFNFGTARYTAHGQVDTSFANQGSLITTFGPETDDRGRAVLITKDGDIVLAGRTRLAPSPNFNASMAGYRSNGQPDTRFGQQGLSVQPTGVSSEWLRLYPWGKRHMLAVGNADGAMVAAKYNLRGQLDSSFGVVKVKFAPTTTDSATSAVIDHEAERIILAGSSNNGTVRPALAAINFDGTVDESFGQQGRYIIPLPQGAAGLLRDIVQDSCDSVTVVGEQYFGAAANADWLITRIAW